MCEIMCTVCVQEPADSRRGHWSPWNWGYRKLGATICVAGIEQGSSVRAVGPLNF